MLRSGVYSIGYSLSYLWELRRQIEQQTGFPLQHSMETLVTFQLTLLRTLGPANQLEDQTLKKIFAVYKDLISRGLPTLSSVLVEENILRPVVEMAYAEPNDRTASGEIRFALPSLPAARQQEWLQALAEAHVLVDPRLKPEDFNSELCESPEEIALVQEILPYAVHPALAQFCAPQQLISELLPLETGRNFWNQRVDFTLITPSLQLVLEVDGSQHRLIENQSNDQRRDQALANNGWIVKRISTQELRTDGTCEMLGRLLLNDSFVQTIVQNYEFPLWQSDLGRSALQVVLAPYAIARIQLTLLLALSEAILRLEQECWRLVIFERDVSCAVVAVVDFQAHLQAFFDLLKLDRPLPTIEISIVTTPEFPAHRSYQLTNDLLQRHQVRVTYYEWGRQESFVDLDADLFIDVGMLQRTGYCRLTKDQLDQSFSHCRTVCEIRSVYHARDMRRVSPFAPIAYSIDEETKPALRFFLTNLFRKVDFREGQFEILARALRLQPVIGLLPTGSGKSLCYQLSALLQPGLSIVIDPILSLLVDQIDNLRKRYAIDWLAGISSMDGASDRTAAAQAAADGKLKLVFLSPERLQSKTFRDKLRELSLAYPVAYAVIDEAHCVSEWGHDFRTAYLRLVETLRQYCRYRNWTPSVIALTGTASYAVLADVQREIGIDDERAQVYPKSFDRKELTYQVVTAPSKQKWHKLLWLLLETLPEQFDRNWQDLYNETGNMSHAGIIFTPHAKGLYGARDLGGELSQKLNAPVKHFTGNSDNQHKSQTQQEFKDNDFALLVATKAFGMGIDKPNIRYTIHYNIPPSLEAFYQEAGRAGRDRNAAWCWLIFSDDLARDADKALSLTATGEVLDESANQPSGGDVHRLLWLHRNTHRGAQIELKVVLEVYDHFIKPKLSASTPGQSIEVVVPFEAMSFNHQKRNDNDQKRKDRDKALYRLTQLKIVQDYTLDYAKQLFEATVVSQSDEQLVANVQAYIGRYKTREVVLSIPDKISYLPGSTLLEKCALYLLDFAYEEIEKKRRTAIRSMLEVARNAAAMYSPADQNRYIRQELTAYLEKSPFTDALLALTNRTEVTDWLAVLKMHNESGAPLLSNVDGIRQLLGGCRRLLELNPDHPGLHFLTSIGRLLLSSSDTEQAMSDARQTFRSLVNQPVSQRNHIAKEILEVGYKHTLQDLPSSHMLYEMVAKIALEEIPTRSLARCLLLVIPPQAECVLVNVLLSEVRGLTQRL